LFSATVNFASKIFLVVNHLTAASRKAYNSIQMKKEFL